MNLLRRRRGRPRKFDEPTRVVSLTLPESVIASLTQVHSDLGHAVTALTRRRAPGDRPDAEIVMFGRRAVISVKPAPALEHRLGVELLPWPDGRALLTFTTPQTAADLELRVRDALEDPSLAEDDRPVFEAMRGILRDARLSETVDVRPRQIIVLEARQPGRRRATRQD